MFSIFHIMLLMCAISPRSSYCAAPPGSSAATADHIKAIAFHLSVPEIPELPLQDAQKQVELRRIILEKALNDKLNNTPIDALALSQMQSDLYKAQACLSAAEIRNLKKENQCSIALYKIAIDERDKIIRGLHADVAWYRASRSRRSSGGIG